MNKNEAIETVLGFIEYCGDANEAIIDYAQAQFEDDNDDGREDRDFNYWNDKFEGAVKYLRSLRDENNPKQFENVEPKKLAEYMNDYLDLAYADVYDLGNVDDTEFKIENVSGARVIEMMHIIFERVIKVVAEQDELVWSDEEIKRIIENE